MPEDSDRTYGKHVIESWETDELLDEYESIVSFLAVESLEGQVSPGEIRRLKLVRKEIRRRIESDTEENNG